VAEELGSGTGDTDLGYVTNSAFPFEAWTRGSPKGCLSWAGVSGVEDPPEGTSGVSDSKSFCDSLPCVALSLVVVGVLDISSQSVISPLPFRPSNRSDSFLLASVDSDCEITTGAETGCCKSGYEGCEDWDVKSPFARSHVLTPSLLVGNFPPSHPELLGVGGVVGSGWVVEVDGDDNAVGELNFWKRRVSEACCDKFRSRENSGEA
jgi:hypothetical protein